MTQLEIKSSLNLREITLQQRWQPPQVLVRICYHNDHYFIVSIGGVGHVNTDGLLSEIYTIFCGNIL